jgi:precorrin-2 dehydrogenase/sirohydrochlorin ferrochelatase
MSGWPVMVNVAGRRVVIVGGGKTALRRARALLDAAAKVVVIAPELDEGFFGLDLMIHERVYRRSDLTDAVVVVAATNDAMVNEQVTADAQALGVPVNRADHPDEGDIVTMAHRRVGPITLAVSTDGISPTAAGKIANEMLDALDRQWVTLLETIQPFRNEIQQNIKDPATREELLRRLTSGQSMRILKMEGPEALTAYCGKLVQAAAR